MVIVYIAAGVAGIALLLFAPIFFSVSAVFGGGMPVVKIKIFGVKIFEREIGMPDIDKGKGQTGLIKAVKLRKATAEYDIFAGDLAGGGTCAFAALLQAAGRLPNIETENRIILDGKSKLTLTLSLRTAIAKILKALIKKAGENIWKTKRTKFSKL